MTKHYSAASEGLAQGLYMAARMGFEHAMLHSGRKASNLPLRYHTPREIFMDNGALYIVYFLYCIFYLVPVFVSKLK